MLNYFTFTPEAVDATRSDYTYMFMQKSIWQEITECDESSHFNVIFRIGIGLALFPHCVEELLLTGERIAVYDEYTERMCSFMVILHYLIIVGESVFMLFLCIGLAGRLSACVLAVFISLHLLPMDDNILGLFLFDYPVYILLYTVLLFIIITGSGPYSIDSLFSKFKGNGNCSSSS